MTSNRELMRRRFLQAPALVTALGVTRHDSNPSRDREGAVRVLVLNI